MIVTVLGSGTLLPDDGRRSPAHVAEAGGARVLLDCGAGTVHGLDRHGIDWPGITHVAISHFHTDHMGDLPALLWALRYGVRPPRTEPLVLLGPTGFRARVEGAAVAFGEFVLDPGFPVHVIELERSGLWEDPAGRFRLRSHPTHHTPESVAYRVEREDAVLGYTGDAGPTPGLGGFLSGCDVLLSECAQADPPELDIHLTPSDVADLAREASPALVVTTHVYPPLSPEAVPGLVRQAGYAGDVAAGRDGLAVEVRRGHARVVSAGWTGARPPG